MFAYLHRQGTHPSMPASKAGTRLRRVAPALAAVTAGLLASAAAIPAAFARVLPDPGGQYQPAYPAPVPVSTVHAVAGQGLKGDRYFFPDGAGSGEALTLICLLYTSPSPRD